MKAWLGGLWVCVAVGGCFAESDPVGDDAEGADSGGTSPATTAIMTSVETGDPGSTSDAPGSTGSMDATSTSDGADSTGEPGGTGSDGDSDSGGFDAELLFDFYDEACGAGVIRAGYTDPEGGMPIDCGQMTPVGFIDTAGNFPTHNGAASRVITMGMAPAPGASVGVETALALPLSSYQVAAFVAELDCGDMSTGDYEWFVSLPEQGGGTVPPVATGVFECGAARELLEIELPVVEDRAVAFAARTEDMGMRLVTLIDPIVVGVVE